MKVGSRWLKKNLTNLNLYFKSMVQETLSSLSIEIIRVIHMWIYFYNYDFSNQQTKYLYFQIVVCHFCALKLMFVLFRFQFINQNCLNLNKILYSHGNFKSPKKQTTVQKCQVKENLVSFVSRIILLIYVHKRMPQIIS